MMWWMTSDTTHDLTRTLLTSNWQSPSWQSLFSAGPAAMLDFWRERRHVGAEFKSVIWMLSLFKIF